MVGVWCSGVQMRVVSCNSTAPLLLFRLFFFFKQKTAYEMRISDWSSDVCSSDLRGDVPPAAATCEVQARDGSRRRSDVGHVQWPDHLASAGVILKRADRKSVV